MAVLSITEGGSFRYNIEGQFYVQHR